MYLFIHFISTRFEHQVLVIRISNCINTSSGMISLCKWLLGMPVRHTKQSHRLIIPDDVLTQFDLLMTSTWCSKHVEKKLIIKYMKMCIRLVINKNLWRDARSTKYKSFEFLIRNVNIHIVLNRNVESNTTYKNQLHNLQSIRSHSTDTTVGFIGYSTMGWITLRLNRTLISEQDTFPINPLHTTVSKSSSEAAKMFLL